jgi:hypothetical protein
MTSASVAISTALSLYDIEGTLASCFGASPDLACLLELPQEIISVAMHPTQMI